MNDHPHSKQSSQMYVQTPTDSRDRIYAESTPVMWDFPPSRPATRKGTGASQRAWPTCPQSQSSSS